MSVIAGILHFPPQMGYLVYANWQAGSQLLTFEDTVKNLLNSKPKHHSEDSGDSSGQPDSEGSPRIIERKTRSKSASKTE